jgi:soluble lytic murein transglycosylase
MLQRVIVLLALAIVLLQSRPPGLSAESAQFVQDTFRSLQSGDFPAAADGFSRMAREVPLLADYADYFLAQSLEQTGRLDEARQLLAEFSTRHPESRLAVAALLFEGTLLSRMSDERGAEASYKRLLERFPFHSELPEARYLHALTLSAQGRLEESARHFQQLWLDVPGTAYGEAAGDQLGLLKAKGVAVPPLSLKDRVSRIERLLSSRTAELAREELEALPVDRTFEPRRKLLLAKAWQALGRWETAAQTYKEARRIAPAAWVPELLLNEARALVKAGQRENALAGLDRLILTHRAAPERPDALLMAARLLVDAGKNEAGRARYQTLVNEYQETEEGATALWTLAWQSFPSRRYAEATERFERLAQWSAPPSFAIAARYWAGRSRAAQGQRELAEQHFEAVVRAAPRSYYGLLAAERLGRSPSSGQNALDVDFPAEPMNALLADPHFQKAELWRRLGFNEFAQVELEEVQKTVLADPVKVYGLAGAYLQGGQYHLALRLARRFFADVATAAPLGLPQLFWETIYPLGWAREIREASELHALDPYYVAAMIREESSFYPKARSPVGALGLMQLMPSTARLLAGPLLPIPDGLEEPSTNVRLGTRFLASLIKEFGDLRLATAAYNAGPARVRQWWSSRTSDDLEVFVELIPFDETRRFVKRVMTAWQEYRRVYQEWPQPLAEAGHGSPAHR